MGVVDLTHRYRMLEWCAQDRNNAVCRKSPGSETLQQTHRGQFVDLHKTIEVTQYSAHSVRR